MQRLVGDDGAQRVSDHHPGAPVGDGGGDVVAGPGAGGGVVGGQVAGDLAEAVGDFVAYCFREVARYLAADDAPARARTRDHVAATIADRRARVVIAHSLGTVVAYEALHAHPGLQVDLLVTLGSPLALPGAVFDRLHPPPSSGIGQRPANVRRWVNISDHSDPIAILRPITKWFPSVDLDLTENVGLFDFHRASRYLACASLAATLQPLLRAWPEMP